MLDRLPRGVPIAVLVTIGLFALAFSNSGFGLGEPDSKPMRVQLLPPSEQADTASRSRSVAPLRATVTPDLLVELPPAASAAQIAALQAIRGVKAVTVVSTGTVKVGTTRLPVMAVDPSTFRPFTPRETAGSDPLWAAVARGELASSYAARLPLSTDVAVNGTPMRVGAQASFGLAAADAVVNDALAGPLGLTGRAVVVAAPSRSLSTLKRDIRKALGSTVEFQSLRPMAITYRRPTSYEQLYRLSADYCPGLSWKVLAAIGQVESGHGRNMGPSTAGALGPMQFLPSTWAFAGVDGDGDGKADIMSAYDAVPAAALYLCRNGAGRGEQGLYNAIFSYNHADWYVKKVLDLAARY